MAEEEPFGYIEEMPESIREEFMHLCQDIASISYKWDFYKKIFMKKENLDLVSELVPGSFSLIEESLRNDLLMTISRLFDPQGEGDRLNLSIDRLINEYSDVDEVNKIYQEIIPHVSPILKIRNKVVGHNDINTRLYPRKYPLPRIKVKEIDTIVELLTEIMNRLVVEYKDTELLFVPFVYGGPEDLIFWLKSGKKYQEEKRAASINRHKSKSH